MDEQINSLPVSPQVTPQAPAEQPPPVIEPKPAPIKANRLPIWLSLLMAFIIIAVLGFVISTRTKPTEDNRAQLTPTPTVESPTPKENRVQAKIASDSAFLALESEVATLSGAISAYQIDDPTLIPPVLDLPLGFDK